LKKRGGRERDHPEEEASLSKRVMLAAAKSQEGLVVKIREWF